MSNTQKQSNAQAAAAFVEMGLKLKQAGERESASGPGSSVAAARETTQLLQKLLGSQVISSILDLGCGDWNWMKTVDLRSRPGAVSTNGAIRYLGWDIHPGLIDDLNRRYGCDHVRFEVQDIVNAEYPKVDLIICRDVLFHLDMELGLSVIRKIRASGAKYFLTTSFPKVKINENIQSYNAIDGWGFYRINLDIAPFSLARQKIHAVTEKHCAHEKHKRQVCVYRVDGIAG